MKNNYKPGTLLECMKNKTLVGGKTIHKGDTILISKTIEWGQGPHKFDFFIGNCKNKKITFYRFETEDVFTIDG